MDQQSASYTPSECNSPHSKLTKNMTEGESVGRSAEDIKIKVKSQDDKMVFFKIKSTTQFKKLMDIYCQRQNLNINHVRFLFDTERLIESQTPNDLQMQNGDQIDVMVQQVGGGK